MSKKKVKVTKHKKTTKTSRKSKFNLKSMITSALRRIWSRSQYTKLFVAPVLEKAKSKAPPGGRLKWVYECAYCHKKYPRKDVAVDHVESVVGVEGFIDWDTYIKRMFCESDNLQILCSKCHDLKTKQESSDRRNIKKLNKKIQENR